MNNDQQKIIAECITSNSSELTEEYGKYFGASEQLLIVRPEDNTYWNGHEWSTDYEKIPEAVINTIDTAYIMAEEVNGCVLDNIHEGIASNVKNQIEEIVSGVYRIPSPSDDKKSYINALLKLNRAIKKKAQKAKVHPGHMLDKMIKKVVDLSGKEDLTKLVKKALLRDINHKPSKLYGGDYSTQGIR